ncbi:MAG: hypothetical protein DRH57_07685 [Candidatus Cloacimonadota bacterium]|nr:MAG: hypothetical protein DRH57_07685 [Candidatus Cloacimonadota bacterium]
MIIEERGQTKEGYEYIIGIHPKFGYRLGYVGVYENSPLYEIDHNKEDEEEDIDAIDTLEFNVHVHGGLTYSGSLNQNVIGAKNPYYFGFDCAHLDDGKISPEEMQRIFALSSSYFDVYSQNKLLIEYTQIYTLLPDFGNATVKTLEFVKNECNHLSTQLKTLEQEYR